MKKMKLNVTKQTMRRIAQVAIFLFTIVGVMYLLPRYQQFHYHFAKEMPWKYAVLTSPDSIPVAKPEALLRLERDSIERNFKPYFRKRVVEQSELKGLLLASGSCSQGDAYEVALASMQDVYGRGVVSVEHYKMLNSRGNSALRVIDGVYTSSVDVARVFTVESASAYIDSALTQSGFAPAHLVLQPSLDYEQKFTEDGFRQEKEKIIVAVDVIKKGERIIGPGEIVDEKKFQQLEALQTYVKNQSVSKRMENVMMLGRLLYVVGVLLLFAFYLFLFRPQIVQSLKNLLFFMIMILLMVALARVAMGFQGVSIYVLPFAIAPIVVRIFFDSRTALFVHIITMLLLAFSIASPLEFLVLQITAGMTSVSSLKNLTQRSQLVRTASLIYLSYAFMYTACALMLKGNYAEIDYMNYLYFFINCFALLIAYVLIFFFEKLFGFLSDLTLVELSNVNNKLLLNFSEIAPGTFQHSLQVANLASEAAKRINANVLLVRTGALYHDIGKMINPMAFTENQHGGASPLVNLDYEQSAQVIIAHVRDGVSLAEKNNLPTQIIDFIRSHHGQSKTRFFYNSFKNAYPDREINERAFMYDGPLPSTKEMAVLMMADAVEATSKSLREHTAEAIDKMVDTIIDGQIADGAFKNAPITLRHIESVKAVFKEKLKSIYHERISYPELNKK